MTIVRSIDVGYSHTKFTVSGSEKDVRCRIFPSLAPLASRLALSRGMGTARDTMRIAVGGAEYEVGPDVRLGLKAHHTRILNDHYIRTPEYLALVRGALSAMHVAVIDALVVGLPVQLMGSHAQELVERLQGVHPVGDGRSVDVRHVLTLAQPLGGFFHYAMGAGAYETSGDCMTLVVDPGYCTLDWLSALGVKVMAERSGSVPGGVHVLVEEMARGVSETLDVGYHDFDAIDRALIKGQSLMVGGREISLSQYEARVKARTEEAVNALVNSVGNGLDISRIVVVGGGATLYAPALRTRFPHHTVTVTPDPMFANVRGFQLIGEQYTAVGV